MSDERERERENREETRDLRAEDIFRSQQSVMAGLAAQISSMDKNVDLLNHNIRTTCDRLDKYADQSHESRLGILESWKTVTDAKWDKFLSEAGADIASIKATLMVIEKWRETMFMKVLALMMLASTVTGIVLHYTR